MSTSYRARRLAMWMSSGILAGVCAFASPTGVGGIATAHADPIVDVVVAPPQPRVEVIPVAPSPHHFWVHGYWAWDGRGHAWVPGHYEVARPGWAYREAHWENGPHGHYRFHQGGWYHR